MSSDMQHREIQARLGPNPNWTTVRAIVSRYEDEDFSESEMLGEAHDFVTRFWGGDYGRAALWFHLRAMGATPAAYIDVVAPAERAVSTLRGHLYRLHDLLIEDRIEEACEHIEGALAGEGA